MKIRNNCPSMVRCAIFGCSSNNKALKTEKISRRGELSYFRFPKANRNLAKIWLEKCGRNDQFNLKNSRVCSIHFRPEDFERDFKSDFAAAGSPRRYLKSNAIPTLFLPENDHKMFKEETRAVELVQVKDEPIDIEYEEELMISASDGDNSSDIFPKLSAYLQLASNAPSSSAATKATNNKIITTAAGSTSASPSSISESNPSTNHGMKISQPMVLAQQQKPQGKISLVPTNILLKPQQQQIQLRSPTPHIIYKSTLGGNASIATSGATTAQMPNGMKVLLVNTLPNGSVAIANGTANDAQSKLITSNAMKGNCITSTMTNVNQAKSKFHNQHNQKAATAENTAGFRSLLTQLISVQNQNLEISRQRLEVERQRLDFEKSVAERIMAALPNIFTPANNNSEVQEPETATTVPLLVPKIEKED